MRIIFLLLFISLMNSSFAQSPKKKKDKNKEQAAQPSSVEPSAPKKEYSPKKSKKVSVQNTTQGAERDFYNRMIELEKTKAKNERMLDKPQYSDPMYFGHKRPPKKRPPSKMKFCKVCGIRH